MTALLELAPEHAQIAAEIAAALGDVRGKIEERLRSALPPVDLLCRHLERYHGKMLRPTMTLLVGKAASGETGEGGFGQKHIAVASVLEIIHLATLVHDDVLDEADTRRNGATVNSLHGNDVAVILGDYLISSAFHLCSSLDSQGVALRIGEVTSRVCEGELLQLHNRGNLDLDEGTYFEIIRRKTASLTAVACELGAEASGVAEEVQHAMRDYGECLGVAFQIRDDLLDITGEASVVGKSLGKDLEKGKLTLPIIHHLASLDGEAKEGSLRLIRGAEAGDAGGGGDGWHGELVAALRATGSIEYALGTAERLVKEAGGLLDILEPTQARAALFDLAEAVLARDR